MADYASNSHKSKEKATEPKKLEKVVSSEVVVKPKSLGSRFKNVFLGGDMNTAASYVTAEVVLPAIRNLLVEIVTKGMDSLIYGERGPRRGTRPTTYAGRFQYSNPIQQRVPQPGYSPVQRPIERWAQGRKAVEDIVVVSQSEATAVVDALTAAVEQYDVVSLADLYDTVGLPSTHVDNKWGWTNLASIGIQQVRNGWQISFPPLEELQ